MGLSETLRQYIDLLCKSANLVCVPRGDKPVELNSEPADLVEIKWLLLFTQCANGILTESV